MALSLLCGGLGVASAADSVKVDVSTTSTTEVYTTTGVDTLLNDKADKTALDNKTDKATTLAGYGIADAYTKGEVDNALNNKADKATTLAGYGITDAYTKAEVNTAVANVDTKLADYAKTTYVDTEVGKKADKATTLAGYGITDAYTKGEVYTTGEVDAKLNTKANQTDLTQATDRITANEAAITGLTTKTTEISYAAGDGTKISGVTIKDGNIVGNGNSAITGLTNVATGSINGKSLAGTTVATEKDVSDAVKVETDARTAADTVLEGKINDEKAAREAEDTNLSNRIGTVTEDGTYIKKSATNNVSENLEVLDTQAKTNAEAIAKETADRNAAIGELAVNGNYIEKDKNVSDNLVKLDNQAKANADEIVKTNERTGGIARNLEGTQTTIEGSVKVDKQGNVKEVKGLSAETITTSGNADLKGNVILGTNTANTVTVNGNADFNEAVNMDKGLTVTSGDTTLKGTKVDGKLTVTDEADLKNTKVDGTLGVTGATTLSGELTAEKNATFKEDVTVKGTTNLKDTTVDGDLKVTGTITTDKMVFGDPATNNYTEIDHGKVTSKNLVVNGAGQTISSSSTFDVEKNEVGFTNTATGDHSYYKQTAKGINGYVTDKDGNKTYTKVTATENSFQVQDKDGKNKNHQVNTKDSSVTEITNGDGKTTKTKQTATDITNTAKDGTITNDGKNIVNVASENISNKSQTMDTTVTGKATESYGELDTTVNGKETHKVTGDQENTIGGNQTTTVEGNVKEDYKKDLTTTVGGNELHEVTGTKTENVTGKVTENYKAGQETNVTGDQDIYVTGKQTNTVESGQENIISGGQTNTITGGQINNITGDQTTTITGNKKETVTENVTEDYKKDLTTTVGGNETHEVKGTKTETVEGKLTENFKGGQETNVTGDQTTNVSGTQTTTATDIKRNASSGMIDTIDNDYGTNTETKVAGSTTTEVSIKGTNESGTYIRGATEARDYIIKGTLSNSETKTAEATSTEITDGNGKTSATIQDKTQISGSVTNGTSSAVSNVKADSIDTAVKEGTNTSLISQKKDSITSAVGNGTTSTVIQQGDKDITIASNGGTVGIVGKDIINNATDEITNTAGTKITDKVGNNTRVIDQTSITDTVGTASRKIEDGKITDTAGDFTVTTENGNGTTFAKKTGSTAYSTEAGAPTDTNIAGNLITTGRVDANELGVSDKDGANSADLSVEAGEGKGVKASAGNGTTTGSLDVKADGITTSITNGTDHNTVSSTLAGGTIFTNSEAAAPVTGASGAGTAVNTTIKGNTITTGKVTMDYAEVMKDLGVRGNANITGKTTTGSLEVTGTSTLKGEVTMESNATVKKDLKVEGTTTTKTLKVTENAEIDGTLKVAKKATFEDSVSIAKDLSVGGDVTAKSYKVGDKTYIDANGIHANDQKITNVADGSISEGSKDAVNGGQLYGVKRDLEHQVDKVGANAAAMANLRPMEFDPSSKWNIAAAIGNYGSETAAALGAFYRPNDNVMVNLSTAFGTGENMVGGGVSVRLGKGGNKLSREETNALKAQVDDLTARMDALLSVLNPNISKDFPDVPENHWAYEAVSRLAGNDIVQGYPDGEFHGERTMTRYEMAEIIYNALSRGAEAERELVEEFKPELQAMAASEKATAEKAEG